MYIKSAGFYYLDDAVRERNYGERNSMTGSRVEEIIVTALEGGIVYWAKLDNDSLPLGGRLHDMPLSQKVVDALLDGDHITLIDQQSENEVWSLDVETLARGFDIYLDTNQFVSDEDILDADGADAVIQYALFGKIVFG